MTENQRLLPIEILPISERWDCTECGRCCRGTVIRLDDCDLQKLQQQAWDKHPDFRGIQTVVRESFHGKTHRLAQRKDGTCVFLMPDGRCAIHKAYGLDAKPLICQAYPRQLIPLESSAILTLRRSCPAAASDNGKPLEHYRNAARDFGARRGLLDESAAPPRITSRYGGTWQEVRQVTRTIARLLQDNRYPLVRRHVHVLQFCDLLEQCHLRAIKPGQLPELVDILSESSITDSAHTFQDRKAPSRAAGTLFRQIAAEYLRLHPRFLVQDTWKQRWELLQMALRMARGKGTTPNIHPDFPVATFASLESPLGHLAEEIHRPLNRYFEVNGATGQYAFASKPGWTILESCRALILSYPVALWMLRLCCQERAPTREDAIEMVTIIDCGQGYRPLIRRQHRRRIATLARLGQLQCLVAWYAR